MPQLLVPLIAAAVEVAVPAAAATAFGAVTFSTIAATVIVTGALAGAALALAPRHRQQGQLPQLPPSQTMMTRASPVANRFYGFGLVSDGGDFSFYELENSWLGMAAVIDCGPIDGVEAWYCDNELLPLSSGSAAYAYGAPTTSIGSVDFGDGVQWPHSGIKYTQRFSYIYWQGQIQQLPIGTAPSVFVEFRKATDAGRPSTLLREFFGDHPLGVRPDYASTVINWGADHKCCGLSMAYMVATKYQTIDRFKVYPEGFPKWRFVRRAALAYDPRDPTQSFGDKSTWKYSRNPAICRAWHRTHEAGFRNTEDEIDWDSFAAAADRCDEPTPNFYGDNEPWARCDMQFNTAEERRAVEDRIDISCDGFFYQTEFGKWAYWIYDDLEPDVTFTLRDVSAVTRDPVGGAYSASSKFVGIYVEPRMNFQNNDGPAVIDDAAYDAIGEQVAQLQHEAIQSFSQSYRLAHRSMRRVNCKERRTIIGGWSLLRARRKRVLRFDCPEIGLSGKFWLDGPIEVTPQLNRVTIKVIKLANDAFDNVTPPNDPVNPTVAVPVPAGPAIDKPATPTLSVVTVAGQKFIQMSIADPGNDVLIPHFHYRRVTTPESAWSIADTILGRWARETDALVLGTYQVEAWLTSPYGEVSPFSDMATIVVS
ncbi:hypothetical protein [Methylosinus sp. LW4]|uniref:hypothetical protein n=1 Tax=Methylosinus sp. LW4 TaxID=136993 RepID=UPI00037AC500|nr:hypothetical protein [Methylosinus sp. LW4]